MYSAHIRTSINRSRHLTPEICGAASLSHFGLGRSRNHFSIILRDYASVVQNLRLVKAARIEPVGPTREEVERSSFREDDAGRILFLFSRSSFSMHDLNKELLPPA